MTNFFKGIGDDGKVYFGLYRAALLFETVEDAAQTLAKIMVADKKQEEAQQELHDQMNADRARVGLKPIPFIFKTFVYKIEDIDVAYPPVEGFVDAFPFDVDHIPEINRDVRFIGRLGDTTGVVTNFLRKEMLKGYYLNTNPIFTRWKYVEDSIYLKLLKQREA